MYAERAFKAQMQRSHLQALRDSLPEMEAQWRREAVARPDISFEQLESMLKQFMRTPDPQIVGELPDPPNEPSDMRIVRALCHAAALVKIAEDWSAPVHCLVCGEQFDPQG